MSDMRQKILMVLVVIAQKCHATDMGGWLSFSLNKFLLKYIGLKIVISYSPILEELTKTICSYYLAADILVTHITFGVLEAIYDWYQGSASRGRIAAFLSIIGHTLFGGLTIIF